MTIPGTTRPRFPGFDVFGQQRTWDTATQAVVLSRFRPSSGIHFFTGEEEAVARALLDRLLAQDEEPRVPVLEAVDERLLEGKGDGYRYEDMPEDAEAWRRSLAGLNADARADTGRPFWDLAVHQQMRLIDAVRERHCEWHGMPASRVFNLWMRYACEALYAHPWAWNEIGFGGPAYPRGYKNLGLDRREEWEVADDRSVDPIPWVRRAEDIRQQHADAMLPPPPSQTATSDVGRVGE